MQLLLTTIPAIPDQTMWLVVGATALLGLYLIMRPKKSKEAAREIPTFAPGRQRQVEDQMNSLIVELSKMARQITAQLDTRAAKLELLIREADEKLAELRAAVAPARTESRGTEANLEIHLAPSAEAVDARAGQDRGATPASPTAPPPSDPRHAGVYALAQEGRSAQDIARLLARPAGEIELILALRPK